MKMTYLLIRVRHCQFQRGRPGIIICKFEVKHKLSKYSDRLYVFIKQFQLLQAKQFTTF